MAPVPALGGAEQIRGVTGARGIVGKGAGSVCAVTVTTRRGARAPKKPGSHQSVERGIPMCAAGGAEREEVAARLEGVDGRIGISVVD